MSGIKNLKKVLSEGTELLECFDVGRCHYIRDDISLPKINALLETQYKACYVDSRAKYDYSQSDACFSEDYINVDYGVIYFVTASNKILSLHASEHGGVDLE